MIESLSIAFILPTRQLVGKLHDLLNNEHLEFNQMLFYAASYVEHEDRGVAESIFQNAMQDYLFDEIVGYDSDVGGDYHTENRNQYYSVMAISQMLAAKAVLAGVVLKPIIERCIDYNVYETHTTESCTMTNGDLIIKLIKSDCRRI